MLAAKLAGVINKLAQEQEARTAAALAELGRKQAEALAAMQRASRRGRWRP